MALRATETKVPPELDDVRAELSETAAGLAAGLEDLQEIPRGIHPAILADGLEVALKGLARRSGVPVDLAVSAPRRLPQSVEVAIYYVVSEALTNAAKHSGASHVRVDLAATNPSSISRSTTTEPGAQIRKRAPGSRSRCRRPG